MKTCALITLAALASTEAFVGTPLVTSTGSAVTSRASSASGMTMEVEMSKSLPFIKKPKNLDGMVGDVGFDPFGFATLFPVKFLREAEIKHGRVCMLAMTGWVVQELVHIPGAAYQAHNPMDAVESVGAGPMIQIVLGMGVLEFIWNKGKMTMFDMFEDPDRVPGDYGFDPLKVSANPDKLAKAQLQELKNGRLAMMAISGVIHQSIVEGHAVPFP